MAVQLAELKRSEVNKHELIPGFGSADSFELMQRQAKLLANSTLVPKEYQNNISNCVIALNMANRMGADPLMVMQNLYVVYGRPGWSSQFLIATLNTSGKFSALRYEFLGEEGTDSWGCRAWAIEKETGEKLYGEAVTIGMAKKEGWYQKNGSKWQTMPGQMLRYRAATFFIRAHAPEISLGMHTTDEIIDMTEAAEGLFEYEVSRHANTEDLDIEDAEIIEPKKTAQSKKDQPKEKEPQKTSEGPGF